MESGALRSVDGPRPELEAFERSTRPLLELVRQLTGLETSFISSIDWDAQTQTVVFSSNVGELEVAEGSTIDWSDSMCRWAFLSGAEHSADVPAAFPGSIGGDVLGMQSFLAVPILDDGRTLGTLCGASRSSVPVGEETIGHLRLIAESLAIQLANHVEHQRDRRRAEGAEVLAHTDSLTGLANHRAFTARLEEELARSGRHGSHVSVLAMDVDSFKAVNDTYGHEGGNDVLVALADVLRRAARTEDTPARLGGDEFAVLLPETEEGGAARTAARIGEMFREATAALGMPATLSVGVASSTSTSRRSVMAAADEALYEHKRRRRGHESVSIELRVVPPEEASRLAALKAATFVETFGADNDPRHVEAHVARAFTAEAVERSLEDADATTWWLLDGEAPVGFLKVNRGDAQTEPGLSEGLEVEQIYVLASHHGAGLGRRLLDHAIGIARAEGHPFVWLGVWEHNERAIAVYEHLGFVPFGEHTFLFGDEEQRDVLMRRTV